MRSSSESVLPPARTSTGWRPSQQVWIAPSSSRCHSCRRCVPHALLLEDLKGTRSASLMTDDGVWKVFALEFHDHQAECRSSLSPYKMAGKFRCKDCKAGFVAHARAHGIMCDT